MKVRMTSDNTVVDNVVRKRGELVETDAKRAKELVAANRGAAGVQVRCRIESAVIGNVVATVGQILEVADDLAAATSYKGHGRDRGRLQVEPRRSRTSRAVGPPPQAAARASSDVPRDADRQGCDPEGAGGVVRSKDACSSGRNGRGGRMLGRAGREMRRGKIRWRESPHIRHRQGRQGSHGAAGPERLEHPDSLTGEPPRSAGENHMQIEVKLKRGLLIDNRWHEAGTVIEVDSERRTAHEGGSNHRVHERPLRACLQRSHHRRPKRQAPRDVPCER